MKKKQTSGGSAASGGFEFQARIGAWLGVQMLAEQEAYPHWNLPIGTTIKYVRCETEHFVDDLFAVTSTDGLLFIQAKTSISLSEKRDGDFSKSLFQCIQQYLNNKNIKNIGKKIWERPLDPVKDRLVIVCGGNVPKNVRFILPNILSKFRKLNPLISLEDELKNSEEKKVFKSLINAITHLWKEIANDTPQEAELREFLKLLYFQTLDFQGADLEGAKSILMNSVLTDKTKTDLAWNSLVSIFLGFCSQRTGVDRSGLSKSFPPDLQIKSPPSFEQDIERLKAISLATKKRLEKFSRICLKNTEIKILRGATRSLISQAQNNSLIVVGEPGAGKSGILHEFLEKILNENTDFFALTADQIESESVLGLRQELGLDYDLTDIFENWTGVHEGFLVIDALDAARFQKSSKVLQDLVLSVIQKRSRWRVIVSIRKFDLRYNHELQTCFKGIPEKGFMYPEFKNVFHINVPVLNEEEILQISQQSQELFLLIEQSTPALRKLLGKPFNLMLVADLISDQVDLSELTPLTTQIQLLNKFWKFKVLEKYGDEREYLLRLACKSMVERERLWFERTEIQGENQISKLNEILSDQILIEGKKETQSDRQFLAFPHHIIFDYAVARLILPREKEDFILYVQSNPNSFFAFRPSLVFYFQELWLKDVIRSEFWDLVFSITSQDDIPEIGKILGLTVAAELITNNDDVKVLINSLSSEEPAIKRNLEKCLNHMVGSILTISGGEFKKFLKEATPWFFLINEVSKKLFGDASNCVRTFLLGVMEAIPKLNTEQFRFLGEISRNFLAYVLKNYPNSIPYVSIGIQAVCRTFETNPEGSKSLLSFFIQPQTVREKGFEFLFWLSHEIEYLFRFSPEFVKDIYLAAFGYEEQSDEPKPIGSSQILSLISNRKQNYASALHGFSAKFRKYLDLSPLLATETLIGLMESYVSAKYPERIRELKEITINIPGIKIRFVSDGSYIWDSREELHYEYSLKMLKEFEDFLVESFKKPESQAMCLEIIQLVLSKNRLAVFLRKFLSIGTLLPNDARKFLIPLLLSPVVLSNIDTSFHAGNYLKSVFPTLKEDEKKRIEETIINLPHFLGKEKKEIGEEARNRLLSCLSEYQVVSPKAEELILSLKRDRKIIKNEPPFSLGEWKSKTYGEEEYLAEQGVPINAHGNQEIRKLEKPIKEFLNTSRNKKINLDEAKEIFPLLENLEKVLQQSRDLNIHPEQEEYGWNTLLEGCLFLAGFHALEDERTIGNFVKKNFLRHSTHPNPIFDLESNKQFDNGPSWGSPCPRINSAEGLILVARFPSLADECVFDKIVELTKDQVAAVRFQISSKLFCLFSTNEKLMRSISRDLVLNDPSRSVVLGFVNSSLGRIIVCNPKEGCNHLKTILSRFERSPENKHLREQCYCLASSGYINLGNIECRSFIEDCFACSANIDDEIGLAIANLREWLTFGLDDLEDKKKESSRMRAFEIFNLFSNGAQKAVVELQDKYKGLPDKWATDDSDRFTSFLKVLDNISMNLYFASGAYEEKQQKEKGLYDEIKKNTKRKERFFEEVKPFLKDLIKVGIPPIAYHLLETLEAYISINPTEVYFLIGDLIKSGEKFGFQFESMANNLFVAIIERYLAEFPNLFQRNPGNQKLLIEILDIFVKAGWSEARKLTYRLSDVYR